MAVATPENSPTPCRKSSQARKLLTDPRQPGVEVAQRPERLGRFGKLFGLEHGSHLRGERVCGYRVILPVEAKAWSGEPRPSRW